MNDMTSWQVIFSRRTKPPQSPKLPIAQKNNQQCHDTLENINIVIEFDNKMSFC